jgi:aminoglycoside phosphotransferase (APT) family kinase protein
MSAAQSTSLPLGTATNLPSFITSAASGTQTPAEIVAHKISSPAGLIQSVLSASSIPYSNMKSKAASISSTSSNATVQFVQSTGGAYQSSTKSNDAQSVEKKHLWEAEQVTPPETALALVKKQFPQLNATTIARLGEGWDNIAYIINNEFIFRFPRREISVPLIDAEWNFTRKLALLLHPIAIPFSEWRGEGETSKLSSFPFIGYRKVKGSTACHANLSDQHRIALSLPIANFLKKLHSLPIAEFMHFKVPNNHKLRINGTNLTKHIRSQIEQLSKYGLLKDRTLLESVVDRSQKFSPPNLHVLVHGDLHVRHIIVNESKNFTGVIDWGEVHIGDPAIDFSIAHSFLPIEAHEGFKKAYGAPISEEVWNLARLRAIFAVTSFTIYGHEISDPYLKNEGLLAIDRINKMK